MTFSVKLVSGFWLITVQSFKFRTVRNLIKAYEQGGCKNWA
jgi:hypothetical protein